MGRALKTLHGSRLWQPLACFPHREAEPAGPSLAPGLPSGAAPAAAEAASLSSKARLSEAVQRPLSPPRNAALRLPGKEASAACWRWRGHKARAAASISLRREKEAALGVPARLSQQQCSELGGPQTHRSGGSHTSSVALKLPSLKATCSIGVDTENILRSVSFGCCLDAKLCPSLQQPQIVACQAPLSMGFSRHAYESGFPFPSPGDFVHPGIKPTFPALQADSLPLSHLLSGGNGKKDVKPTERQVTPVGK